MAPGDPWPICGRCDVPMLFRAQLPLSATSLVAVDDDRMLLVFECHSMSESEPCDGGAVLISSGQLEPRAAPTPTLFDVVLTDVGPNAAGVRRVLANVCGVRDSEPMGLPRTLFWSAPRSIADGMVGAIREAGGAAVAQPSGGGGMLAPRGGRLVPFDDATPGVRRTTLPPLKDLLEPTRRGQMTALLGGQTPGYRDHSFSCACGRPTRTALRLLARRDADPAGVALGPAVAQVCLKCSAGHLQRLLMSA